MFQKNDCYQSLCIYCDRYEKSLVAHYTKDHSDHEVPIARPSPTMVQYLCDQSKIFHKKGGKITGFCYFCEDKKTMNKFQWQIHLLTHTGEKLFNCESCNSSFNYKSHHKGCDAPLISIYDANDRDGALMAFLCNECNYTQINREKMIRHLMMEHEYSDLNQRYQKVPLLPDLSSVNCEISYKYIASNIRFKCTICGECNEDVKKFEQHFDERHYQAIEYDCCCGEKMALENCTLTGSFVAVHLLEHSANLFMCMICEENGPKATFFEMEDIQNHLLNVHEAETYRYKALCRGHTNRTTVTENTLTRMWCNLCKEQMDDSKATFTFALEHSRIKHNSEAIDFKALITEKDTVCDTKVITSSSKLYELKF